VIPAQVISMSGELLWSGQVPAAPIAGDEIDLAGRGLMRVIRVTHVISPASTWVAIRVKGED
jgi:hypothetical protein